MLSNKNTENFQTLLDPVFYLLDVEFKHYVLPKHKKLYPDYRDKLFANDASLSEMKKLIVRAIAECLNKINTKYLKKLSAIYTEDGVNTILYDYLYTKLTEYYSL
jgi:hypothetical protein